MSAESLENLNGDGGGGGGLNRAPSINVPSKKRRGGRRSLSQQVGTRLTAAACVAACGGLAVACRGTEGYAIIAAGAAVVLGVLIGIFVLGKKMCVRISLFKKYVDA